MTPEQIKTIATNLAIDWSGHGGPQIDLKKL